MQPRFLFAARTAFIGALLVLAAPIAVLAQGGKAEPLRIAFNRGAHSATLSESVHGSEEAEYVLAAKKGQRLTIKLTSVPNRSSVFEFFGEGDDRVGLRHDAN